ncbi:thiazole synthase [Candidatus Zinderia endosymbiont of Aphrophora alni]|uniref:thiazole synthase n=1 Tax=Candidatus Zinderia endosymbiont of Aphrophora alni TaxID=3077951 RepID=UPI0030D03A59
MLKKNFKNNSFILCNKKYKSRLLIGTGKYRSFFELRDVIKISKANIITISIKRLNLFEKRASSNLLKMLYKESCTILPNTANCYNAEEAVYVSKLSRELLEGNNLIKLEILGDKKTLLPNMQETFKAVEILIKDNFKVMVYCTDDSIQAKILEKMGVIAIMPLASMIGSGMGILNKFNLSLIVKESNIPIIVDAGIGTASDAVIAMEIGCDGVLMNTAIAKAKNPIIMANAMKKAVQSGRQSFLAGRMNKKNIAFSSSPKFNFF